MKAHTPYLCSSRPVTGAVLRLAAKTDAPEISYVAQAYDVQPLEDYPMRKWVVSIGVGALCKTGFDGST